MSTQDWTPVTHETCRQVEGPFYHGTRCRLAPGDLLTPGFASNDEAGRVSRHVYFSPRGPTARGSRSGSSAK